MEWEQIRARLAQAMDAVRHAGESSDPRRERAVMEHRARAMARPPAAARDDQQIEVVTFSLGQQRYAFATEYVHAVRRDVSYTPLPHGSPDLCGITHMGGVLIAVADPRGVLGAQHAPRTASGQMLIVGRSAPDLALLVSAVEEVRLLPMVDLSSLASLREHGHFRAILRDSTIVVDGASFLSDPRFLVDHRREGAP